MGFVLLIPEASDNMSLLQARSKNVAISKPKSLSLLYSEFAV